MTSRSCRGFSCCNDNEVNNIRSPEIIWDAGSPDVGSYVLTVIAPGQKGDLYHITKIINRYSSIASCISLDINREDALRRVLVTLPAGTPKQVLDSIVKALERKDFRVTEIENLQVDF